MNTRRSSLFVVALLSVICLAFVLRAAWGLRQSRVAHLSALPDQVEYLDLAESLLRDGRLSFYDGRANVREWLRAYRTPLYPAFLAACGADARTARLVQALIGAMTALGAYVLARRWLSRWPSLLAALLVAINPYLIYFSGLILSETLYTSMLIWGMVLICRAHEREDGPLWRRSGVGVFAGVILLALAILARPSGLFLPIVLAGAIPFVNRERRAAHGWPDLPPRTDRGGSPVVRALIYPAAAVVITILVLLPWAARNKRVLGQWIWTTTNGGITLYDGFNPMATGASDQSFLKEMPQVRYPKMNEVERAAYFLKLARQWAIDHPARALKLTAVKIARTWSPIPLSTEYGGQWKYVLIGAIFAVPLDILILLGLAARGLPLPAKIFLLLPAFYFTVIHGLSVGSLRYRIPVEGPMAVIAACRLAALWRRSKHSRPA